MLVMTICSSEEQRLVRKALELKSIAARVEKEHRCLLARSALEADFRCDQELEP